MFKDCWKLHLDISAGTYSQEYHSKKWMEIEKRGLKRNRKGMSNALYSPCGLYQSDSELAVSTPCYRILRIYHSSTSPLPSSLQKIPLAIMWPMVQNKDAIVQLIHQCHYQAANNLKIIHILSQLRYHKSWQNLYPK